MNNNLMISTCLEFGETGSMAKAQYEWDALEPECTTQKLQAFLDKLQNTAGKHFGTEAQQFIDAAIYAKNSDHVKKILNKAYLEKKPYNDIVLHLKRDETQQTWSAR